jgi:hypothetical protein
VRLHSVIVPSPDDRGSPTTVHDLTGRRPAANACSPSCDGFHGRLDMPGKLPRSRWSANHHRWPAGSRAPYSRVRWSRRCSPKRCKQCRKLTERRIAKPPLEAERIADYRLPDQTTRLPDQTTRFPDVPIPDRAITRFPDYPFPD